LQAEEIRLSASEAKRRIDAGEAIVLDVVQPDVWEQLPSAISGAVRISPAEVEERFRELPLDREIIAYCT
jgi:rhodanese-related sulfurtransferase